MLDLARFEFTVFSLFDAAPETRFALATPESLDVDLSLHACVRLSASRFNVASYYHQVRRQGSARFPGPSYSFCVLVRTDFLTRTHFLTEAQYHFLHRVQSGQAVPDALKVVSKQLALSADDLQSCWRGSQGVRSDWIANGLFVDRRLALAGD
ncbi:hypothetical protein GCM10023333_16440 [Ferrimonas pelagia]|uniref:Uncharacterized protein n=2 Tax=Ferrimonas pelagia TaxID=1177826 RepID=A0ABP9EMI5_9GAMM